jgi:5-methylcytosine-specific restriction endonuclease McrA
MNAASSGSTSILSRCLRSAMPQVYMVARYHSWYNGGMTERTCDICGVVVLRRINRPRVYCSVACKAEAQRRQKPATREWLYQKYVIEGLGAPEIAALVNRNAKQVWWWLRGYGIPTRPRGSDQRQWYKQGALSAFAGHRHTPEARERFRQLRLADGHVPYLRNGTHHLKGKRGAETPNWKGGVTPERQALYSSPEWTEAVKAVWQRDKAICQRCQLDHRAVNRSEVLFDIHHIVSFSVRELRCEVSNLVLLCASCHDFVHSNGNIDREFLS